MVEETISTTPDELKEGVAVSGTVTRMTIYGAMVDIGIGQDALFHVSQIEAGLSVGDTVSGYILKIDSASGRAVLTTEKPPTVSWSEIEPNAAFMGTVTRIEKYGVFVDIGAERSGMVHVSELADGYVQSPEDVVHVGQEVEVRVLRANRRKRQIDLTMKQQQVEEQIAEDNDDEDVEVLTAMEIAFRRAQSETAPDERRSNQKSNRNSEKIRQEREDIMERTLRSNPNS